MSLYSLKKGAGGAVQPWSQVITLAEAGKGCDGLFGLYGSLGDVVSTSAISIPSVTDGPGVVVRYNNLTLSHLLTTTNRCRSLTVLVDGNLVINSGGGISMTARGARGNAGMGQYNRYIPYTLPLESDVISLVKVLAYIRANKVDVSDRWFWDEWSRHVGVTATFSQGAALALMLASGCGAALPFAYYTANVNGYAGSAGVNGGTGGGGRGGIYAPGTHGHYVGRTGSGTPWGGGPGQGGAYSMDGPHLPDLSAYGDSGGDARSDGRGMCGGGAGTSGGAGVLGGPAGGDGTGGILRIIVKGNTTINSGGIIQADGLPGGSIASSYAGGGGSGGGHVSIITLGSLTNNGTIRANGGAATTGASINGGAGGAGSVVTKTFAQMGW